MSNGGVAGEFREAGSRKFSFRIGKSLATALSGFIAGVAVTFIILYPWLYRLGQLCPSVSTVR